MAAWGEAGVLYIILVITTAWEMRLTLAAAIITRIMYNIVAEEAAARQGLFVKTSGLLLRGINYFFFQLKNKRLNYIFGIMKKWVYIVLSVFLLVASTETFAVEKSYISVEDVARGSSKSFFSGTKYTNKVFGQISKGDFHAFPESVKAFEKSGVISTIKGGDGITRQMLKIPGQYRGKNGFFEFIKEADGSINHRLFRPTK